MKNKSKTEIRVGIITIASIIVVLWILGWAKNIDPLDEKLLLNIKFDSVAGLNVGDPVAINGVKKGYVNNISSIDNGVLVNVTLEKDVIINEDAKISVMMLDLMGGKIIEINPGQSKKTIDFSITQAGSFSGDISTAMAALSSVQNDLIDLVHQLKISMNGVNTILGDEKFISDIKNSVRETNETLTLLHKMLSENRGGVKQLVSSGNELIEEGNNLLAETKEPLVTSLQKLNTLLDSSDSLLIRLNAFSDEVKSKGNNFGKLLYDDEMMNELKDSIIKINQLTKILIEQLENDGVNVDANIDLF